MRHAVIMCGGSGTRLWPLSRKGSPKQFQKLFGNRTLIQQTYDRIAKNVPSENIWVMTNENFVDLIKEQLPAVNPERIITEPVGRNTAPATGLAMIKILEVDPDATIFGLLPADHYIGKPQVFNSAVETVFKFLDKYPDFVATIGINPTEPNTGYGYIQMGEQLAKIGSHKVFKVDAFIEKPNQKTAQELVEKWEFLWNGGYFIFKGARMLEYYRSLQSEMTKNLELFTSNPNEVAIFESIESLPIDKAIAEKLDKLAVVPVDMDWSDVGNWSSLQEILSSSTDVKQVIESNHIGIESEGSFVLSDKKLVATIGLNDIIVIDTEDAILVARRDAVQDVKKIVEKLQELNQEKYL